MTYASNFLEGEKEGVRRFLHTQVVALRCGEIQLQFIGAGEGACM